MPIHDPGSTGHMRRAAGKHLPLAPADDRVQAPSPVGRTVGIGAGRPCTNTDVTVPVMAPRRAAAGLAAAQMVQLMAAEACACSAAIASAAGLGWFSARYRAWPARAARTGADAAAIRSAGS